MHQSITSKRTIPFLGDSVVYCIHQTFKVGLLLLEEVGLRNPNVHSSLAVAYKYKVATWHIVTA